MEGKPVANLFDEVSHDYERQVESALPPLLSGSRKYFAEAKVERLLRVVEDNVLGLRSLRFLDVGCGIGNSGVLLAPRVGEYHGVDISEKSIKRSQGVNPTGIYKVSDGKELSYPDNFFDVTFTVCVLHHVRPENWNGFLVEMARVTRPGGLVVVFEHNPLNPWVRWTVARCEFDKDAVLSTHFRTRALMKQSGLVDLRQEFLLFTPFPSPLFKALDRSLGWCPMGAQYLIAGRKP